MEKLIQGYPVVPGQAHGESLASSEPLSFWGGYDQNTGEIIDRRHPLSGQFAAGKVLCIPAARGSSTTTAVLLEAVRSGHAPAAILTNGIDQFFALASTVAEELYGKPIPIVALDPADFSQLCSACQIQVFSDGNVLMQEPSAEEAGSP